MDKRANELWNNKKKTLLTTNELALIVQDTSCVKRLSSEPWLEELLHAIEIYISHVFKERNLVLKTDTGYSEQS